MTKHAQLSIIDALMTREEDLDLLPEFAESNIDALSCVPIKKCYGSGWELEDFLLLLLIKLHERDISPRS